MHFFKKSATSIFRAQHTTSYQAISDGIEIMMMTPNGKFIQAIAFGVIIVAGIINIS